MGDGKWPGKVALKAVTRAMRHDGICSDQVLEEGAGNPFKLCPQVLLSLSGIRGRAVASSYYCQWVMLFWKRGSLPYLVGLW